MTETNETPTVMGRGFEDSAGQRVPVLNSPTNSPGIAESRTFVVDVLNGRRDPSELPSLAWDVFSFGFRLGCEKSQVRIDRLEAEADRLWYELRNPEDAKARHRQLSKGFDIALNRATTAEKWAELDRIAAERSAVHA